MKRVRIPRPAIFIFTDALTGVWLLGLVGGLYAIPAVLWPDLFDFGFPLEALLTFAVGVMMAIRINRTYERWWEARKLWGTLVNVSRNLAIKLREFVQLDEAGREATHRLIQGFARALKNHLRGAGRLCEIRGFEQEQCDSDPDHVPAMLAGRIYAMLAGLRQQERITDGQLLVLDREAHMFMEVSGACERIANTPMSPSFPAFIRFCMLMLLLALPWDLADQIGWWAVPTMVVATYLVAGGEAIAATAEKPFETDTDSLDLEGICDAIDTSVAEILSV